MREPLTALTVTSFSVPCTPVPCSLTLRPFHVPGCQYFGRTSFHHQETTKVGLLHTSSPRKCALCTNPMHTLLITLAPGLHLVESCSHIGMLGCSPVLSRELGFSEKVLCPAKMSILMESVTSTPPTALSCILFSFLCGAFSNSLISQSDSYFRAIQTKIMSY